jgi:hypothetical protein
MAGDERLHNFPPDLVGEAEADHGGRGFPRPKTGDSSAVSDFCDYSLVFLFYCFDRDSYFELMLAAGD